MHIREVVSKRLSQKTVEQAIRLEDGQTAGALPAYCSNGAPYIGVCVFACVVVNFVLLFMC